jgi:hypothetical protein
LVLLLYNNYSQSPPREGWPGFKLGSQHFKRAVLNQELSLHRFTSRCALSISIAFYPAVKLFFVFFSFGLLWVHGAGANDVERMPPGLS